MPDESVKVAVRVRPFNQREKDRSAKLIIKMQGQMTTIANPETPNEEPKSFSFDYSYWSHDGFQEKSDGVLEPAGGSSYASQRRVFEDLGQGVLDNAFEGYNCSLFAYGQTGSGKSYSMVGYGQNKGIVPITCDEMFKTMDKNADPNKRFEVTFSMLEIYNEQVRDLLSKDNPKGGLNVRQNPKLGLFYVENLKRVPVGSYAEIEKRTDQGTASRTVASTNMNATSSRAHTVVTITFDQIIKSESGSETKKSSVMNLVDLAGSERADSTGATGDRLKEGANINKSLSALGNVISALADLSMGTKKKIMVPYRDSVLTKLLQNALGGNSKTIMIAALSPADINYDETLSTLRYADRAKKIKNKAVVNENPLDKLIRELKEENERLKKAMEGGGVVMQEGAGLTPEELDKMRKQMEEDIRAQLMANQAMIAENAQSWDDKLAEARTETEKIDVGGADNSRKSKEAYLINLNEDPMLSGVICHFLNSGETSVGRKDASPVPNICLSGLSIQKQHAVIFNKKGVIEIESVSGSGSKTKINGIPLTGRKALCHKDRILFGSNHMYVLMNPLKPETADNSLPKEITWEYAQKEIAQVKGFATGSAGLSKEQQIVQEQVLEILPMVSEVNAVSEELNKQKSFEVVLISAAAQEGGDITQSHASKSKGLVHITRVTVKMKNLLNGNTWLWERGKFITRRYLIQELYQKFLDGENISNIPKEQDPFWEPTEDVLIGTSNLFLQSLSYCLDFEDTLNISDYKGQEEGHLKVKLEPCDNKGKPIDEEAFVDDPHELLNKPYHFKLTVENANIHKSRFSKGIMVKYSVKNNGKVEEVKTPTVKNTLTPTFNHSKVISIPKLKQENLDFFESGCITLSIYGIQEDTMPDPKLLKLNTRELRQMENMENSTANASGRRATMFGNEIASDTSHLKTEVVLLQRKYERLQQKERRMQQICEEWSKKPDGEKQFEPFYRAVSAVANSTGTRLKTRVQMLNQMLKLQKTVALPSYKDNSSPMLRLQKEAPGLQRQKTMDPSMLSQVLQGQKYVRQMALDKSSVIEEKDGTQGDQDSFGSVDLEPYMNADPEDSADRSKRFTQNGNRTGLLSDINTKREVLKPARNAVSEYSANKKTPSKSNGKRPSSADNNKTESSACVLQ
ncbi:kinesin-like protein KIF28 isoform X5 [Crassostrea angulata]|uniref:kinesin-like protein KIF28 isoform X5 n=1 Tax=Magallana angulata TaxID=2784310 RepID=UPI0022B0F32E|nr:kinesin-like protein KIF28 isoform X5 [Crassostrea angulata]